MDLGLPDGEGVAHVRRIREADTSVAIVVLTGLEDERAAQQAFELGAHDYLVKGRVWGEELPDSDSLRVHIHGLRAVIDKPFPTQLVQTRHGIGYRIAAPDASS